MGSAPQKERNGKAMAASASELHAKKKLKEEKIVLIRDLSHSPVLDHIENSVFTIGLGTHFSLSLSL